jgi:hypothetical protein
VKLAALDAALAANVEKIAADAANPTPKAEGGSTLGGALSLLGGNNDKAKAAAKAIEIFDMLMQSRPVTPVEERILGRECLAVGIGKSTVLPDESPVASYVRWVGAKVAAQSTAPYPALGLDFIVIKDDEQINAMATPGGPILITTGMLMFLDSEDELAAILAHEVGHVEERHGLWRASKDGMDKWSSIISLLGLKEDNLLKPLVDDMLKDAKLSPELQSLVADQVIGKLNDSVKNIFEDVVMNVTNEVMKKGDPGMETCADFRGMSLAKAAGYEPISLQNVLIRLKDYKGDYGGAGYSASRLQDTSSVMVFLPDVTSATQPAQPPSAQAVANWKRLDEQLRTTK